MPAFRLAHLSDPHLGPLPPAGPGALASKRLLGYANWRLNRGSTMEDATLQRLVDDLARQRPDHLAVTGDLVNIALPEEFPAAARWLARLGAPEDVSVVPGNHDAYVPGALARALACWRANLVGDACDPDAPPVFPYVRVREPVALVGVSSAVATPPFWATGLVRPAEAAAVAETLERLGRDGLFRVLLVHHPPLAGSTPFRKRLVGAARLREAIRQGGCELVLHGHTHLPSVGWIEGVDRPVPVVGVPSASESGRHGTPARYNIFEIDTACGADACTLVERGLRTEGGPVVEIARRRLRRPDEG